MIPQVQVTNTSQQTIHRDDTEIRQRLLQRLGIGAQTHIGAATPDSSSPKSTESSSNRGRKKIGDDYVPTPPPPSTRKRSNTTSASSQSYLSLLDQSTSHRELLALDPRLSCQKDKKLQFVPYVSVVNIPSHRDYHPKTRKKLWSSLEEIQLNGERNAFEFAADNQDWRKATEDDVFIAVDGELYHPVTYRYQRIKRKQTKKKKKKKRKGNIPKKSIQRGGGGNKNNALTRVRTLSPKSGPSLTRFADT